MTKRNIPEAVAKRALTSGEETVRWLDELDGIIEALEGKWHIRVGEALSGGTHAFVAPAKGDDGNEYVLKVDMPEPSDEDAFEREIRFLELAGGNGYVKMYAADMERRACLMERLGSSLMASGLPARKQMWLICKTLEKLWSVKGCAAGFSDGFESVNWFRKYIPSVYEQHGRPCPEEPVTHAMKILADIEKRLRPEDFVPVHGDAHGSNALLDGSGGCTLIDADGLFHEKAYDLGVLMRDWTEKYAADPLKEGIARCSYLCSLTGADEKAVRQWGYIQCVATALTAWEILPDMARMLIRIAESWIEGSFV